VILIPAFILLTPAHAGGWQITVQTDRSYYHAGDIVYISGRLTYSNGPRQSVEVAISVTGPSGSGDQYYYGSSTTNTDGKYAANFRLESNAELGTYVVHANAEGVQSQTTFQINDTIYIKSDGDVEPANAPISRNGDLYNLTSSIPANSTNGIIIERNDIILNGMGFTLNGKGLVNSNGIYLARVSNITIENMSIESFQNGVNQYYCPGCHIVDTNLFSNGNGIYYQQASSSRIEGNNITKNGYAGILLDGSYDNSISGNSLANTISSNFGAISIRGSSYNNNIVNNNFANNTLYGVYIEASYSNSIFHNNFFNNTRQGFVTPDSSGNVWDSGYPSGGNYWSDYKGIDAKSGPHQDQPGSDGIGDAPYTINANNKDRYPFMSAWVPTLTTFTATNGTEYPVTITTANATITQINSTPNNLNFTVTGTPNTNGSLLIIVPKGLNTTALKVTVNGTALTNPAPTIIDNGTHYFIYCAITFHSTLQILVPFVVPMIPMGTLTATVSMISVLGVYIKLRRKKTPS
jgi:parallel beta-helix repeat protein